MVAVMAFYAPGLQLVWTVGSHHMRLNAVRGASCGISVVKRETVRCRPALVRDRLAKRRRRPSHSPKSVSSHFVCSGLTPYPVSRKACAAAAEGCLGHGVWHVPPWSACQELWNDGLSCVVGRECSRCGL